MFNYSCDMVLFYNINSRLDVLIYWSWRIGDLEAKVFKDKLDLLDHFVGK